MNALQEQIDQLKQELEAKDDCLFEVSATLAAVQSETQHRLQELEFDASKRIRQSEEALRRAQQEANQAHHSVLQLQQQLQLQRTLHVPPLTKATADTAAVATATAATTSALSQPTVSNSPLAGHLLLLMPTITTDRDNVFHFLLQSQQNPQQNHQHLGLTDLEVVSFILESETRHRQCVWIHEALRWSTMSRAILRESCALRDDATPTLANKSKASSLSSSRIILTRSSLLNVNTSIQQVETAMREPLLVVRAQNKHINTRNNGSIHYYYNKKICHQWMGLMVENLEFDVLLTLFQDVPSVHSDHVVLPWWELFKPVIVHHIAQFCCLDTLKITTPNSSNHHRRRHRRYHPHPDNGDGGNTKEKTTTTPPPRLAGKDDATMLSNSLALLRLWWHASPIFQTELMEHHYARSLMAILLDMLEQQQDQSPTSKHCCVALEFIQTLMTHKAGVLLLRTQMGGHPSGIQVLTLTLANLQIQEEQNNDKDDENENDNGTSKSLQQQVCIVRIFWMIMRSHQVYDDPIPFTSLLEEKRYHWLACMNKILIMEEMKIEDIKLVQSMLEEIQMDQEELEDYRQQEMCQQ